MIDPNDWAKIRKILHGARELPSQERIKFLDEACVGNPILRQQVEALLKSYDQAGDFLETPFVVTPNRAIDLPASSMVGQQIGQYQIKSVIGRGGMGVVYEAEQKNPSRTVALKVIHPGMATVSLLRRFEHESQILGRLHHPGIAQIFEAGRSETDQGPQPFFAMELVRGERLTKYAKARNLEIPERLELLIKICEAVHHAHQKGVIHRDLKPGNILVDPSGQPKVLDFGVARLTDSDVKATTVYTNVGQLVGTLPYMSPEQVAGDPLELDTRSDVYALGVIGYELLSGQLPYDLKQKSIPESARIIGEADPTPLSATNRFLRGDLETIFAKALEKDKTRRYQSASDLAEDIRRYLRLEPILARPISVSYQFRKLVARHKLPFALAAGMFLSMSAFAVVAAVQASRIAQERDKAFLAQRETLEAREDEKTARLSAEQINQFLKGMLASASPYKTKNRDLKVREVLDRAAKRIEAEFADQPEVEAGVRLTIGQAYMELGLSRKAEPHLRTALKMNQGFLGENHPDTLHAMTKLAWCLQEKGQYEEAEPLFRRAFERSKVALGEKHPSTLEAMKAFGQFLYNSHRDIGEAEFLLRKNLELRKSVLGEGNFDTLSTMEDLGTLLLEKEQWEEALHFHREALEGFRRFSGEENPFAIASLNKVAHALHYGFGKLDEAESLLHRALELSQKHLGKEHPHTFFAMDSLANVFADQGRFQEAEKILLETLDLRRKIPGLGHPKVATTLFSLGRLFWKKGANAKAESFFRDSLEIYRQNSMEKSWAAGRLLSDFVEFLKGQGKLEEAEMLNRNYLEVACREFGETDEKCLDWILRQGTLLSDQGKYREAEEVFRKLVATLVEVLGEDHFKTTISIEWLGYVLEKQGRLDEADPVYRRALNLLPGLEGGKGNHYTKHP